VIEIVYHAKYNRVTVKGHAKSDEPGKDIVCAAASMLATTLADNVYALYDSGAIREFGVRLDAGDAEIMCVPMAGYRNMIRIVYEALTLGFAHLAQDEPDYVTFSKVEG